MKLTLGMGFICGIRESISANDQQHQYSLVVYGTGPKTCVHLEIQAEAVD